MSRVYPHQICSECKRVNSVAGMTIEKILNLRQYADDSIQGQRDANYMSAHFLKMSGINCKCIAVFEANS